MHGESKPPPTLTFPLMIERMLVTDEGQEPHLASLSPKMRSTITNVGIRACLAKAWETTLWARCWTRFPNHLSRIRLKGWDFLGDSISQRCTIYNGRIDLMEHVSHFNQRMTIHSKNEALMCKVFPSSLGPVTMRWFDGLGAVSISSFKRLTQAFNYCFITCSRVSRPLDSLLSLSMREGETLKTSSDWYWEIFNEINGDFDDVAISTFKVSLPIEHNLRKFFMGKPVTSVR